MAIVPLDRITIYGAADQEESVLDGLQRLGCLHLVDLAKPAEPSSPGELVSGDAREALAYLRACPVRRRQTKSRKGYDLAAIDARALEIKRREEDLNDERDYLGKAIADLRPWGDFHLPPPGELGGARLWFYVIPHRDLGELGDLDLKWQVVAKDTQFEYVVVIHPGEPAELPLAPAQLDRRPLSELEARLEEVEEELEDLGWERVAMTRWCTLLSRDLDEADDRAAREAVARRTLQSGQVFAVQGWCPKTATGDLKQFAERRQLALTVESPREGETPPTLLKNPERTAAAEGAVTFYITPNYRTWDPSTVVYFSFSLFFAMIVADAGYGLIFAALLRAFWGKLGASRSRIRARNFLLAIVVTTILYGVLVGSYFGMAAPPVLDWLHVLDIYDQGTMMALAIVIGVAHLVLANLIAA
ncbi:MAG: V-type ATP synthase subunit I, partial [Planctomycetota bacterium]